MSGEQIRTIAVIPARCGSQRFPGKNIYPLCGKPLISYPIEAAIKTEIIEKVLVSTDCEEVAEVARQYGAEVPFLRPEELSGSVSPVVEAMIHAVEWLDVHEQYRPDYIFLLQPTTPIIAQEQFDSVYALISQKRPESVITVTKLQTTAHPYNIRVRSIEGKTRFWQGEDHYRARQLCPETFYAAANMWVTSYETLINKKRLEGEDNYSILVDWQYAMDIDYQDDLHLVEAWLEYTRRQQKQDLNT